MHGEVLRAEERARAAAELSAARPARRRLRPDLAALVVALVVAHLFYWRIFLYPSDLPGYDARNYFEIAADIGRNGLLSKFHYSDVRTYGYPLFLLGLERLASASGIAVGLLVFEAQLALYLLAAWFLRSRVATLWPSWAPAAFVAIAANAFALSYTPESLTESVSATLIVAAAGCWVALLASPASPLVAVLAGSLAMGAAVAVRPANLFALFAWTVSVVAVVAVRRAGAKAALLAALALAIGVVVPLAPQYVNNVRHYDRHTALVAGGLGHHQQNWGIANLKYATAVPPVATPSIFYRNPFAAGRPVDASRPWRWYVDHPGAGAVTVALHLFNMLDQDLLFTYSRNLDPWYRLPVGVANHALIALAVIGCAMLAGRARRERALLPVALAGGAYVLAHLGVHATTLVEMRFGLPLLLFAGMPALVAFRAVVAAGKARRVLAVSFVVAWITGSLALSDWVRDQAPAIRAWQSASAATRP